MNPCILKPTDSLVVDIFRLRSRQLIGKPIFLFDIPPEFDVPLPYFRNMVNEKLIREKILESDILAFELQMKKSDTVVVGSYVVLV